MVSSQAVRPASKSYPDEPKGHDFQISRFPIVFQRNVKWSDLKNLKEVVVVAAEVLVVVAEVLVVVAEVVHCKK